MQLYYFRHCCLSFERSREFLDALKKAKDKNPDCIVRPKVTMKNKGTAAYKGTFPTVEAARNSDKVICLIPGNDGHIYEMHKTEQGESSSTGNAACGKRIFLPRPSA